ncbi:MAG: alpha/beta fold hydrolase [Chloroflexi bacterium]|nr:alpha/beta fold hydrolase [Chloroflexota bacterium]
MVNSSLLNPQLEGGSFFKEAGPCGVILIHGYTATTVEVRLLAERLFINGYTVAAPLLAGHGTHPEDLNNVTWQDWVDSAVNAYAQLTQSCQQIFIGGQSMGGVLALYLAGMHPEAAGVLLYAPAIRLSLTWFDKIKLHFFSMFLAEVTRTSLDMSDHWQGYPGLPLKGVIQLLKLQAATNSNLSKVFQPVIIFQGRKDKTVHINAGDIILQGVHSNVKEHHWMEKSSHAILIDCELDEVTNLTLRFLEKVSKRG